MKILKEIFNYEKNISENRQKIFNENQYFYLINKELFDKYLEYYEYDKLKESLLNASKQNPNNLSQIINLEKDKFKDSINDKILFLTNDNNLSSNNYYIIPSKIIYYMNENEFRIDKISNNLRKIFVKKNDIYFIIENKIIVGNLEKYLFIPKYILSYNSKGIMES